MTNEIVHKKKTKTFSFSNNFWKFWNVDAIGISHLANFTCNLCIFSFKKKNGIEIVLFSDVAPAGLHGLNWSHFLLAQLLSYFLHQEILST